MRPRQALVKHNLNVRKNVNGRYGRPRHTVRHHAVIPVGRRKVVTEQLIEQVGMERIKQEIVLELAKDLLDNNLVTFTQETFPYSNSRTITAKLNLVKNG
jgi:hypothetical protein